MWIAKNVLCALLFFAAVALVAHLLLGVFTRHGQVIEVPDMTNLSVEEAGELADAAGIRVVVSDSTYVRRMAKGAVFKQNPAAGAYVKKGRRVMLTINTVVPKKVSMPNLIGVSMRQAKAELSSRGLALGTLTYVEDIATNNVLKQTYRGRNIAPESSVESGSSIDLTVGLSEDERSTHVPSLVGLKYVRAVDVVHDNSLNVGTLVFDSSVKDYSDSLDAVVYRQGPAASSEPILMGSEVSLYLTVDPERIPKK